MTPKYRHRIETISTIVAVLMIIALFTLVDSLVHHKPKTFTDLAPNGHLYTDKTYNAVVNDAGGRNVNHVFQYGKYAGKTWEPTGKTFAWGKRKVDEKLETRS
ncbi:MAG: hypothetical protein K6T83_03650 [Alicyclobacillus sp.]|nr:hypothetical protein [Alicyclobacillus sp.]